MGAAVIISGLLFGCMLGGCSWISDQPEYQEHVKPYVDKAKELEEKYIDPYRDEDAFPWDKEDLN